ncbi:MAG TPA: hypothetical protein VE090_05220 [Methylomirabilota bacterium]|nr:hypothetical protein [Methylomirabilota bacterium]
MQEIELTDPYYFNQEKATVEKIHETTTVFIQGSAITSVEKITDEEARKLYVFLVKKKR